MSKDWIDDKRNNDEEKTLIDTKRDVVGPEFWNSQ